MIRLHIQYRTTSLVPLIKGEAKRSLRDVVALFYILQKKELAYLVKSLWTWQHFRRCIYYNTDVQSSTSNDKSTSETVPVCTLGYFLAIASSIYCHDLGVCHYRRGMDWILNLLTICIHHSELHFTNNWHMD
jgi:hypothetical protein